MTLPDPMLATAGALPVGPGWAYEVKWDGIRCLLATGARPRARSRPGRDLLPSFPELATLLERPAVVDGELIVLGADGRPDFDAVRRRLLGQRAAGPAVLQVFDVLRIGDRDVRDLPYRERRRLLGALDLDVPRAHDDGPALLEATRSLGLEGVVAKRLDAPYLPGRRTRHWVKVKHRATTAMTATAWICRQGEPAALFAEGAAGRARVELGTGRRLLDLVGRRPDGRHAIDPPLPVRVSHGQRTAAGWLREAALVEVQAPGVPWMTASSVNSSTT